MIQVLPAIAHHLRQIEESAYPFEPLQLATELDSLVTDPSELTDDLRLGCLAEIVAWRFAPIAGDDRQPWGTYFGPVFTGIAADGQQVHSPDARQVPLVVLQHWAERSQTSPHPLIRARFADLAWEFLGLWNAEHADQRVDRDRHLAQTAIDAYVEAAINNLAGEEHYTWSYLRRAVELSLFIQDKQRIESAKKGCFAYARTCQGKPRSGHWWNLHAIVWDQKRLALDDAERDELIEWLEQALAKHSDTSSKTDFDPHWAADAAEMLRLWRHKLKQPDEAVRAIKQAGAAFEAMAQTADAMTSIAWLEDLSAKYRREGLLDDASRVEAGIRSRAQAAEDAMVRHEVRYEVPPEEMETWLSGLMAGSLHLALGRIAVAFVRSEASLQQMIDEMQKVAPLQAHMPISIMGPHGFTVAKIGSSAEDPEGRKMHMASTLIGQEAPWLNWALERAKQDWQLDGAKLFEMLVQSPMFAALGHGLLLRGLKAWEQGDFPAAIHILVPQMESAIRELMTGLGESPMRLDERSGGFESKGLGEMLHSKSIKGRLDPALLHHFRCLYTHPKGLNLRNRLAHGWAGEEMVGRAMANWVVHSLIALRVYVHGTRASPADNSTAPPSTDNG